MLKSLFSANQDIFNKNFVASLVKFSRIFWSLSVLDNILWYLMNLSEHLKKFTAYNRDFVQFCCILLIITCAFDDNESLLDNFGLV
jgi:hypothetical protein